MVKKIVVKEVLTNKELQELEGKQLPSGYFSTIIQEDADVFREDGSILLKFRKRVLPQKNIDDAYNAMIEHARQKTSTRGVTGGETGMPKLVQYNNKIMSNIMGYFDTLSVRQKWIFKEAGMKKPICRETSFTGQMPEKWNIVKRLIRDIDRQYKKLFPKQHKKQKRLAQSTKYVIDDTAFSTITTNLNLQTGLHYDKGDYKEGFGNLVVIEKGTYKGGFTGFPKYGVAVDVRTGDFLGMDVHELHGNEPIEKVTEDAERLSIVSYLREGIVNKCKNEPLIKDDYFEKARRLASKRRKEKRKTLKSKKTRKQKKSSNKTRKQTKTK